MKQSVKAILVVSALSLVTLIGCSNSSEDGPNFSDQDLLNRAKSGREQGEQGSKTAPTATTGTTG